ncbi:MAG: tyrosine-type recombinase/integrase [Anaerolineae bacterium]|nr:tyrosine-type recombinase/integrase [Anaerolineae bacterium]
MSQQTIKFVVSTSTELEISVKEFVIAKQQEGLSPGSIKKYEFYLGDFVAWCHDRGIDGLPGLGRVALREWGAGLHGNRARATVRLITSIIRSFLAWCYEERLIDEDLATALKLPKVKIREQRTLTADEFLALLRTCDDDLYGVRDAAIISLMVDSGLRVSELCGLRLDALIFEPIYQATVISKGGDEEPVYFGEATAELLRVWLRVRPGWSPDDTVFVALGGNTPGYAMTRSGILTLLLRRCFEAGIPPASPHALRRTFACLADEAGASTRKIQEWGRWSDIKMVERYTQGLKAGRLYRQFSPADHAQSQK